VDGDLHDPEIGRDGEAAEHRQLLEEGGDAGLERGFDDHERSLQCDQGGAAM
jgi:hypothetical protein